MSEAGDAMLLSIPDVDQDVMVIAFFSSLIAIPLSCIYLPLTTSSLDPSLRIKDTGVAASGQKT
jgi:hypothetical protein